MSFHTRQPVTFICNGSCPICPAEVSAYRRHAGALGLPLDFADLAGTGLNPSG